MISARKIAANRANAQASTGPRTAAGKAHSARNAVKHGLASHRRADPAALRAIEQWEQRLAGEAIGEERELAYGVAAAQVELERVRAARMEVYNADRLTALVIGLGPPFTLLDTAADDIEAIEEQLCEVVWRLDALRRYDDRAYARRERAVRQLDDLRTGTVPEPPRLPRPRGLRLPRWRLPNPDSRVIKFAGLPRWAWWRPDPLDEPPKRARAPRRRPEPQAAGELELMLRPELLLRAAAQPLEPHSPLVPHPLPPPPGGGTGWGFTGRGDGPEQQPPTDAVSEAPAPTAMAEAPQRGEGEQPTELVGESKTDADGGASSEETGRGLAARGDVAERGLPEATDVPETQDLRKTKPRWGAKATPLPTCRVGPCRWEGEVPADHWSYRGWRYLRPPGLAAVLRLAPLGPPLRQRRTTAARSRAPPP